MIRDRLPSIIAILLLVLLVAATKWAVDYTQSSITLDPPRRVTHEPDAWGETFTMVSTDQSGLAANRLEGSKFYHYPDDQTYEIIDPVAIGNRLDTPITIATSKTAIVSKGAETITMLGQAHVVRLPSEDDDILDVKSDVLIIKPEQDLIYTDEPALVINGKSTMRGKGMRYDNRSRQLQVHAATDVTISGEQTQQSKQRRDNKEQQP